MRVDVVRTCSIGCCSSDRGVMFAVWRSIPVATPPRRPLLRIAMWHRIDPTTTATDISLQRNELEMALRLTTLAADKFRNMGIMVLVSMVLKGELLFVDTIIFILVCVVDCVLGY